MTPSLTLFTELLYAHVRADVDLGPQQDLFGVIGFQSFSVSAANPFNPFGEVVGIAVLTPPEYVNSQTTDFVRPVIGARGTLLSNWQWEASAWDSEDKSISMSQHLNDVAAQTALNSSDPSTALNPFTAGPPGSPQLLQSVSYWQRSVTKGQLLAATGFVRGPLMQLPAGPLNMVFGAEYNHTRFIQIRCRHRPFLARMQPITALATPPLQKRRFHYSPVTETHRPVLHWH